MRVLWGPEFILLYNDSYRPILGRSKHPGAMGRPTAESFSELWSVVEPLFRRVHTGETIALEDTLLPIDRSGYLEECFFTLSYSPLLDDTGAIAGVLGVVHETTDHVIAARRLATLRELAAKSSSVATPEGACELAADALARNPADVPFSALYLAGPSGADAHLVSRTGLHDEAIFPPTVALSTPAPGGGWPFACGPGSGPFVVTDVEARFGSLVSGPYPEPVRTALVIPLKRVDAISPFGFLVAGINPRRALDDVHRGFFELVSEQISGAVSDALERRDRERLLARERAADARLRLLFDEAPAAIAVLRGPDLVYEFANPLYCRLVGRDDLVGHRGRDVRPDLARQGIWDLLERVFATGEPFFGKEFPATLDRTLGHPADLGYFNFVYQPTRDLEGRVEGVMIFAIEVTEMVLARRAAEEGHAERTRLLASEQAARAEAVKSNQAKDEFLAIVSHELRNPLSVMLGWTRILRSGTLGPEKTTRALEMVERSAVHQSQLIDDLLDVSRIISGKLRLDVKLVSFVDVVRAALDSARPAIDAKQLRLKAVLDSEAVSLMGDATRLQQIVWNLISNATKFTPKGGAIQVVLKRVESAVELSVQDTGSGIDADFLPHVFERFRQANSSATRAHGGLGLGLSIARNLVEMHGGTIEAFSEGQGRGATFVVRLPVAPLRESAAPDISAARPLPSPMKWECPPDLVGLRVLVVDDESDARALVAEVLEQCGAEVYTAASAQTALAELERSRPDVLLSDIGMPGEDGFALIRQLRSRSPEGGGFMPAASLTAYASAEDRRRSLLAGFNMHVPKPVEPAELVAVVSSLGRMARALR
jgi:signal transduction histidine kinase